MGYEYCWTFWQPTSDTYVTHPTSGFGTNSFAITYCCGIIARTGRVAVKASPEQVMAAHRQLQETQFLLSQFNVLLLSDEDAEAFKKILKKFKSKKRYVDLMIAAMAIAGNHVVVTRNTKHFKDVLPPHQLANWIDDPPS